VLDIVQVADRNIDGSSQINGQQFGTPVAKPDNFSTQGRLPESFLKNGGCVPNQSLRHSRCEVPPMHRGVCSAAPSHGIANAAFRQNPTRLEFD